MSTVLITGGTGYIGRPLISELISGGHTVRALVRHGSEGRCPPGTITVLGDALDPASVTAAVSPADTFIHLVGTPKPNPTKTQQFYNVDLASIRASVMAVKNTGVQHMIYVSVAQPAPIMRTYIESAQ